MSQGKASVLHAAKYILHELGETTCMKLEKLCYYAQAWSLAWDDVPLFDEDFEAWANGPVCPELYARHKGMFLIKDGFFKDIEDWEWLPREIETFSAVLESYAGMEPHWLSDLTHQELPWKAARSGVPDGDPSRNIITKESMQMYYSGIS